MNLKTRLYVLKLQLTKKHRNVEKINTDWDQNTWSKYNVDNFPFGSLLNKPATDEVGTYQIDSKTIKLSRKQFLELFEKRVLELFSVDKSEKITELGCGIGNKLFFLWKNGYANLTGYDLSQNAIKLAKSVNEKYGCGIKFDTLDIIKEIPSLEGQIIYTFTCLEQLPHYMETVINNLVSAKPKKVIHFEFALEYSTKLSRSYIKARDYQTNLLPLLKKDPRVSIIKCEPLNIGNPVNPLTCIEWKPS